METEKIISELKSKVHLFAQKVAPLYVQLEWKWERKKDRVTFIPSAADIEKTLYSLIDDLQIDKATTYSLVGSGGLEVYYEPPIDDVQSGEYGLRFVLGDISHFD